MITNVEEENFNPPLTSPVQTSSGKITGFVDEANEVQVYLGIPYAEPPTGALRYKPTKELITPYVERVCTEHAPAAPQTAMPFDTLMCVEIEYQSEDCLYLNVWVPVITANNKKLPVIVWFHPGACMSGSSSQPFWDGTNLARNEAIIVSFNYRLGALGWMAMGHISEDLKGSGNLGLLDQMTALKWVQKNIAAFGGDPDNVTAFGSSAGAACILALILTPHTGGLFHNVILQSPPMFMCNPSDWSQFKGSIFSRSLGLDTSNLLEEIQQVPVETILDAQTFMTTWPNFLEGLAPIGPSQDNHILNSTLLQHLLHHPLPSEHQHLKFVMGYTRDEFNFFFPFLPNFQDMDDTMFVRTYFTHVFGKNAQHAYEIYKQHIVPPMVPPSEVTRQMCSDVMACIATLLTAENLSKNGHAVWVYEWDYESNDAQNIIKAAHMVDSVFSWDNLAYWTDNPFLGPGNEFERDRVAKQMSRAVVAFACNGNPNHEGIAYWPTYDEDSKALVFDREVYVQPEIHKTSIRLWKTELKEYVTTPLFPVKKQQQQQQQENITNRNKKRKI